MERLPTEKPKHFFLYFHFQNFSKSKNTRTEYFPVAILFDYLPSKKGSSLCESKCALGSGDPGVNKAGGGNTCTAFHGSDPISYSVCFIVSK
jgi:hypothetical protein